MKTPYVPHLFGEAAQAKLNTRNGWLTAGVSSSIPWPQEDVWVMYDGHEYVLRGAKDKAPCVSTPCPRDGIDATLIRVYRFASVLGWFKGGYVDPIGSTWGSAPMLYGTRDAFTTTLDGGRYFDCNYLPLIEDDQVRKALAFMREGRRLRHVHGPYSFLSFFKVVESQFNKKDRVAWIQANLDQLTGDAAKRVAELRAQGLDASKHLYDSGRCAIAHASLGGVVVDPDIPSDRRRIMEDLDVMAGLAIRYLKFEAQVPDSMELYKTRDRTEPWHMLLPEKTLIRLKAGEEIKAPSELGKLEQNKVSVQLWPNDAPEPMRQMDLLAEAAAPGIIRLLAVNERKTIFLRFALDIANGLLHTLLEDGGISEDFNKVTEDEIEHYTRYFHSVVGNAKVELCIDGTDPVPCEIVIPVNIIPQSPEEMVSLALEQLRRRNAKTVETKSPETGGG
ncbi:MAG: methylamine utilization protein MauJ [Hylemonella sp.]|uniref:methylamine utilization protein MauJ n=1 Tax=Hylemonella sp. TaxID=2066020 RepID=UPI00391A87FE